MWTRCCRGWRSLLQSAAWPRVQPGRGRHLQMVLLRQAAQRDSKPQHQMLGRQHPSSKAWDACRGALASCL